MDSKKEEVPDLFFLEIQIGAADFSALRTGYGFF